MSIHVNILTLKELLEKQLVIPEYQRFYVWDKENVDDLLNDLKDFFLNNENEEYYLGTVILHNDKTNKKYNIIDGQQRILTLLIILYVFEQQEYNIEGKFNNKITMQNIRNNYKYVKEYLDNNQNNKITLLNNIIFTEIETDSEDEAFIFFDTQNGRGVTLDAIDYLKSYHLRAIKDDDYRDIIAEDWDQNNRYNKNKKHNNLNILFNEILWKARRWTGRNIHYENIKEIKREFEKNTKHNDNDQCLYYTNIENIMYIDKNITKDINSLVFNIQEKNIKIKDKKYYPFKIRQPIMEGINFFLYTNKYNEIYKYLFYNDEISDEYEIKKFNKLYTDIYKTNISKYLKSLFELLCVVYYDKYGEKDLFKFALYCDYLIGNYRILKARISKETIIKILKFDIEEKETDNLLDIIQMSFEADEIIKFIDKITPKIKENIDIKKSGVISKYIISYSNFIKDKGIDINITWMKDKKNIKYKMNKLKDRKNSILEIISKGQ
ncbi:hypothetical protein BRSU_2427 [Brachyspira suanatina]|uniref:Uncharacterized protein n=1 Tax=Brachyspira suanatina TaxID=381802 RepID=A0A0G4KAJ5_9SPIR|nr:DUF262 domain-containing protein [Brachyspira suanatina]CRF35093.1 hypothetical protein BRSU_2427 [Brachyspira suanatina]